MEGSFGAWLLKEHFIGSHGLFPLQDQKRLPHPERENFHKRKQQNKGGTARQSPFAQNVQRAFLDPLDCAGRALLDEAEFKRRMIGGHT